MKTKNKKIVIAISIILLILLVATISVLATRAWFISTRQAEGTLNFVDGIKINYSNMYEETSTSTNSALKLQTIDNNKLEVNGVTSNMVFKLKNPTLTPEENTVEYYVRAKLTYKLYFKNADGNEIEITDATRNDFLATTSDYEKNGALFTVENEFDLFTSLPEISTSFVKLGDWYYLGTATSEVNSLQDITLEKCFYNNSETKSVEIFKLDSNNEIKIAMDDSVNTNEKMPFSKLEIVLNIEAVEESALVNW